MIQMMDNTPWVERYSIYSRVEFVRQTHYDEGGLTPMGVMYRDHEAPLAYLQALPDIGTRSLAQLDFNGDVLDDPPAQLDEVVEQVDHELNARGLATPSDLIVVLMGAPIRERRQTNLLRVHRVRAEAPPEEGSAEAVAAGASETAE
jgi:pyruvate kinase